MRIEEVRTEAPGQRARVVDIDDAARRIDPGHVLRHAAQAVVRQAVRRNGGIGYAIDEIRGHQLRRAFGVEPVGNRLRII